MRPLALVQRDEFRRIRVEQTRARALEFKRRPANRCWVGASNATEAPWPSSSPSTNTSSPSPSNIIMPAPSRGHRAQGGMTRTHSRTSSGGSKIGLNLQFTQKDAPPPRLPDKSRKSAHFNHEVCTLSMSKRLKNLL